LSREGPEVLISNGAGVAVPFFYWGKFLNIPLVFIEVYDRIDTPSVTGQLVAPLADRVILQWEEQREHYPEGTFMGTIR
ncbi:MAG: UDP-N-acetylglucosamine--LPS N-acetylglucosamine transferase, partial [Proteobacteria bacterium]|nr:UDP-N-acetylglucosamine--LPS N-acetylglucosamine transferase [Pseudomonadota bacterium]